jgi:hypothetical protein
MQFLAYQPATGRRAARVSVMSIYQTWAGFEWDERFHDLEDAARPAERSL